MSPAFASWNNVFWFIALFVASPSSTQTPPSPRPSVIADQVLERWARAVGTAEKLASIENVYIKNRHEGTGGTGDVEEWTTRAGERRQSSRLEFDPILVVFDGVSGWQRRDGPARKLNVEEAAGQRAAALFGAMLHLLPGHPGVRVELLSDQESECCHAIRVRFGDGSGSIFHVDKTTGLPVRNIQQFPSSTFTFNFVEWKEVDGVKLPAKWHITSEDGYEAVETLKEARLNVRLDKTLFSRPPDGPKTYRFAEGETTSFPFETDGGHILVGGRVQGSEPVWLLLDTAASGALIDADFARSIGLQAHGEATAVGPAGPVGGALVSGARVALPGVELTVRTAQTMPLEFLSRGCGRKIVAILGHEFFERFVVEVDYTARVLRLSDPDSFRYAGRGESIPMVLHSLQPYVRARVDLGNGKSQDGEFVVDAGSSATLMLAHDFASQHGILATTGTPLRESSGGVGGQFDIDVSRIEALHLGSFKFAKPVTLFPSGQVTQPGSAGNIGAGVLKRFRVIFDYARERIILEPTPRVADPDEYDMSGLGVVGAGPKFEMMRVKRVSAGSPAAEAGIERDDIIERVNGRPAAELGFAGFRDLARRGGSEMELEVRTKDSVRSVKLKLRRRI